MPLTRVYLPLTPAHLAALAAGRSVGPVPLLAHAVTPALGKPGLVTDEEELEHAAWLAAADQAGSLSDGGRRRVVAAADVDASTVGHPTTPGEPSRVELSAPVDLRRIVSFHVDEEPGATDAADLLWYDVTELAEVRALVSEP
ncbi:MAG: hypothetical protein K0R30_2572 [Ornithinibacter sp.]|jgi:hypothetical protein|nr:hypothetical protein [Ornithinibacter sp.]